MGLAGSIKPLRNPKYERFARAIVFDGKEPGDAYVAAGFERNRANHNRLMRDPRVKARIAELSQERELAARAARARGVFLAYAQRGDWHPSPQASITTCS